MKKTVALLATTDIKSSKEFHTGFTLMAQGQTDSALNKWLGHIRSTSKKSKPAYLEQFVTQTFLEINTDQQLRGFEIQWTSAVINFYQSLSGIIKKNHKQLYQQTIARLAEALRHQVKLDIQQQDYHRAYSSTQSAIKRYQELNDERSVHSSKPPCVIKATTLLLTGLSYTCALKMGDSKKALTMMTRVHTLTSQLDEALEKGQADALPLIEARLFVTAINALHHVCHHQTANIEQLQNATHALRSMVDHYRDGSRDNVIPMAMINICATMLYDTLTTLPHWVEQNPTQYAQLLLTCREVSLESLCEDELKVRVVPGISDEEVALQRKIALIREQEVQKAIDALNETQIQLILTANVNTRALSYASRGCLAIKNQNIIEGYRDIDEALVNVEDLTPSVRLMITLGITRFVMLDRHYELAIRLINSIEETYQLLVGNLSFSEQRKNKYQHVTENIERIITTAQQAQNSYNAISTNHRWRELEKQCLTTLIAITPQDGLTEKEMCQRQTWISRKETLDERAFPEPPPAFTILPNGLSSKTHLTITELHGAHKFLMLAMRQIEALNEQTFHDGHLLVLVKQMVEQAIICFSIIEQHLSPDQNAEKSGSGLTLMAAQYQLKQLQQAMRHLASHPQINTIAHPDHPYAELMMGLHAFTKGQYQTAHARWINVLSRCQPHSQTLFVALEHMIWCWIDYKTANNGLNPAKTQFVIFYTTDILPMLATAKRRTNVLNIMRTIVNANIKLGQHDLSCKTPKVALSRFQSADNMLKRERDIQYPHLTKTQKWPIHLAQIRITVLINRLKTLADLSQFSDIIATCIELKKLLSPFKHTPEELPNNMYEHSLNTVEIYEKFAATMKASQNEFSVCLDGIREHLWRYTISGITTHCIAEDNISHLIDTLQIKIRLSLAQKPTPQRAISMISSSQQLMAMTLHILYSKELFAQAIEHFNTLKAPTAQHQPTDLQHGIISLCHAHLAQKSQQHQEARAAIADAKRYFKNCNEPLFQIQTLCIEVTQAIFDRDLTRLHQLMPALSDQYIKIATQKDAERIAGIFPMVNYTLLGLISYCRTEIKCHVNSTPRGWSATRLLELTTQHLIKCTEKSLGTSADTDSRCIQFLDRETLRHLKAANATLQHNNRNVKKTGPLPQTCSVSETLEAIQTTLEQYQHAVEEYLLLPASDRRPLKEFFSDIIEFEQQVLPFWHEHYCFYESVKDKNIRTDVDQNLIPHTETTLATFDGIAQNIRLLKERVLFNNQPRFFSSNQRSTGLQPILRRWKSDSHLAPPFEQQPPHVDKTVLYDAAAKPTP